MGEVRTISRKGLPQGRNPQRLYARDECTKQFTPRAGTSTFVRAKSLFGIGPVQSHSQDPVRSSQRWEPVVSEASESEPSRTTGRCLR